MKKKVKEKVNSIIPKELEPLADKAIHYETVEEFEIELKRGHLRPVEILQKELETYKKDLEEAQELLSVAKNEIDKENALKVIKDRSRRIEELTEAIEGHEAIEKIKRYGFSLEEFYKQATRGIRFEPVLPTELELDKLRAFLEKRLPDLRNSFDKLEKITTRRAGVRGASSKKILEASREFRELGRQIGKEIFSLLGYKDETDIPYGLRDRIERNTDYISFEPSIEEWINSIRVKILEIKGERRRERERRLASEILWNLVERAKKETKLRKLLEYIFENDWETIKERVEKEGVRSRKTAGYSWWRAGVVKFVLMHKDDEIKKWEEIIK